MSLLDTTSAPVFLEIQPDWSRPVTISTAWATAIQTNRESGEQRARTRSKPRIVESYERRAIRNAAFALQRGHTLKELGKAVVVPIWTEYGVLVTNGGNSVTLTATITSLKFKVGSWIYALQGANACFRKITAVAGAVISLSSSGSDFYPVGFNFALFTSGARIYPCILGIRSDIAYRYQVVTHDMKDTTITVEEL